MKSDELYRPLRRLLELRRSWRFRRMLGHVRTWDGMTVLDVGCGTDGRSFSDHADASWKITGIDLHAPELVSHNRKLFEYRQCGADDVSQFGDKSFDLVVSVGMIEHITDERTYRAVCSEIQRVGKQFVVIAPYKWAGLEPHYGFPLFGALPPRIQVTLIKLLNLSGHRQHIDYFLKNFKWRSNSQYESDFGGSRVYLLPVLETIAIVRGLNSN